MGDEAGLLLIGLILLLGPPVLAVWAFVRTQRQERVLQDMAVRLRSLEQALGAQAAGHRTETETAAPIPEPASDPAPDPIFCDVPAITPPGETSEPDPSAGPLVPSEPVPEKSGRGEMADRWLIWVGGVALALGGAFLVRHSIDQGWLGPWLRCLLGGVLGLGMIGLGSLAHSRTLSHPDTLPSRSADPARRRAAAALVAAGLACLYASLYAAYGLYGLMGPAGTFLALAGVSAAGVLLSLRHGSFVAALAIVGGYGVPLIVTTEQSAPLALFGYLLALTAAAAALLRWRPWPWLGGLSLLGNGVLTSLFLVVAVPSGPLDDTIVTAFLLAMAAVMAAARVGVPQGMVPALAEARDDATTRWLTEAAFALAAGLLVLLALETDQGVASLSGILMLTAGGLALARRDETLWLPAPVPVLAGLLTLAGWDLMAVPDPTLPEALLNPPLPDSITAFLTLAGAQGALVALTAHLLSGRTAGPRPMAWGGLAMATPLLILCVAFWRLRPLGVDLGWATCALALGGAALLGAARLAKAGQAEALGAHAVGVLAAVALAAAFALEQAWLTVALAATLPAVAWVEGRLGSLAVPGLRRAALVMAAVVLVRLVLNPYVLDYPLGAEGVVSWLWYGYGLPAAAFALAVFWFQPRRDDLLVAVLQGGTIALALLLAMLQVRHAMVGPDLASLPVSLSEWAAHTIVLLSAVVLVQALRWMRPSADRPVVRWAEHGLAAVAGLALVAGPVTLLNPVLTGDPVGVRPIINTLLALYGVPSALLGWWAWRAQAGSWPRRLAAPASVALALLWLTLEVRHAFTGAILDQPAPGEAELYAYSVLWLVFGMGVVAVGARFGQPMARRAGLALVLLVTLKVFFVDLAGLNGLWRALSFLGLGAALVGLGALTRALERPEARRSPASSS